MSFNTFTGSLTGGLIDPKAPDYAGTAAAAEARRKALINAGMANIDTLFSGGSSPLFSQVTTPFASGAAYRAGNSGLYTPDKRTGMFTPYGTPSTIPGPGSTIGAVSGIFPSVLGKLFGHSQSPKTQTNEMIRRGSIFNAPQTFTSTGFTPDFYKQASDAYTKFALPQLAEQYQSARDATLYGVQNRGLQGSSVQDKALSDLTLATGRQQQQIADNATGTAQALRKQVEDARQSAIDQLYQTADPSQALRGATATAAQFKIPQTFTPLLNAFSGIANQYAMNQLFNNYNPQMYSNPYALPSQQGRIGPTTY